MTEEDDIRRIRESTEANLGTKRTAAITGAVILGVVAVGVALIAWYWRG